MVKIAWFHHEPPPPNLKSIAKSPTEKLQQNTKKYSKESTTKLLESINEFLQDCKIEGQYIIVFTYITKIF